jgi:hypothetical protein
MQIRARQNKRRTLCRPLLTVLLLSVPVIFIFLSSVLWGGDGLPSNQAASAVTNKTITSASMRPPKLSNHDRPTLYYEKVIEDSNDQIHRYAAYVVEGSGAGHDKNNIITIRRWAELMAHEDSEYSAALARNISSILKARGQTSSGSERGNISWSHSSLFSYIPGIALSSLSI